MMPSPHPLEYAAGAAPSKMNWLCVAAFAIAMLSSPMTTMLVLARPFWDGHSLHFIRAAVESVSPLLFPAGGIVTGLLALVSCAIFPVRRRGAVFAWIAIGLGIAWYAFLVMVVMFVRLPVAN
jgi:ABC-type branched-subunit amino acid transport system permease subunit